MRIENTKTLIVSNPGFTEQSGYPAHYWKSTQDFRRSYSLAISIGSLNLQINLEVMCQVSWWACKSYFLRRSFEVSCTLPLAQQANDNMYLVALDYGHGMVEQDSEEKTWLLSVETLSFEIKLCIQRRNYQPAEFQNWQEEVGADILHLEKYYKSDWTQRHFICFSWPASISGATGNLGGCWRTDHAVGWIWMMKNSPTARTRKGHIQKESIGISSSAELIASARPLYRTPLILGNRRNSRLPRGIVPFLLFTRRRHQTFTAWP